MVSAAIAAADARMLREQPLERGLCRHCGLELGASRSADLGAFCCAGCKTVHALLGAEGLERYYELRAGSEAPPPQLRADTLAWLDPLLDGAATDTNGVARIALDVQGVHCAACVWLLQELWSRHDGGVDVRINPALGRAEFAWQPGRLDLRDYVRGAERFGYRFGPQRKGDLATSRALVVRLGICLAAALNVMIFSLCFYLGLAPGDGGLYAVLGRWSFALASVAVLAGGSIFFVSAWRGIVRGVVHLDLPIALGIALSYAGSTWAWLSIGPEAAYFDTVTIFVALMVLGRWLQERVVQRNRHALLSSDGVEDLYVRRRRGAELQTVSASSIEPGDELWVLPGDLVPVEACVLAAPGRFSLDWITGESRPRAFEPGETVPAGAFQVGDQSVRLAAREGFAASRLHTLLSASGADAARGRRAASDGRGWSRFALVYVALVLSLAAIGLWAWSSSGAQRAIEVALSVLVVTCPCALGLATPLAHELVHSALRRRGIFLREGGFLQRVLKVRHVIFDKTGTLTRGTLRLSARSIATLDALPDDARAVLAEATARSLHPVSRTLNAHLARDGRVTLLDGLEVREVAGRGLEVRHDGRTWRLGRREFALEPASDVRAGDASGVCLAVDGAWIASFELEEDLKTDAREEVARLREHGCEVHLLSGDRPERVERVARVLGLDASHARGAQSPEDKARYVRALDREDTWMVGDGINDAPAFDAAACAATPAVDRPNLPARADLYYLGDGVGAVRTALTAARDLSRVVRTNLVLAVAYNVGAVGACLAGHVGPLAAAVLMPASSVGLIGLTTYRLSRRSARWTS